MFKDFDFFEIDASEFEYDAHIEFGTDKEKEKWVIIFAGWHAKRTRITENIDSDRSITNHTDHSRDQWRSAR